MNYDKIILEMLDRIKALEDQVKELNGKILSEKPSQSDITQMKASKKYRRLSELLDGSESKSVTLTFNEIEKIVGFTLPESAREHRAFWANTTTHSIALSWLSVGYKTVDVDIINEIIVFERRTVL